MNNFQSVNDGQGRSISVQLHLFQRLFLLKTSLKFKSLQPVLETIPLLEVRCDVRRQFAGHCRDLEETTSDSALVKHPTTPPIQQSLLPPLSNFLGHEGQSALIDGCCPYCQAWLEGTTFIGEDSRNGGLVYCQPCRLAFAWIDSPFECEISDDIDGI